MNSKRIDWIPKEDNGRVLQFRVYVRLETVIVSAKKLKQFYLRSNRDDGSYRIQKFRVKAPHGLSFPSAVPMYKAEPRYPPAPELHGELLLDVFTHPSLRLEAGGSQDNERYTVLGQAVLDASMTHCVFLCHPHFGRGEIEVCVIVFLPSWCICTTHSVTRRKGQDS